jgi:hypothetical protein
MRHAGKIVAAIVVVYVLLTGMLFALMRQPPDRFAWGMSKLPMISMMVLPFEPLWMRARAGHLQVGDAAPDFDLESVDKQSRVRLSSYRGVKPVVLVFGSYT